MQATLMGFDLDCLPVVKNAFDTKGWKLTHFDRDKVSVSSNNATYDGMLATLNLNDMLQFRPHFGWAGYVETQERLA